MALADIKEKAVQGAAEKLINAGHRVLAVACDVSNDSQVEAMVGRTVAEFGRLDAAFNNAGVVAAIAPTADATPSSTACPVSTSRVSAVPEIRTSPMDRRAAARSLTLLGRRPEGRARCSVLSRRSTV